MSTPVEALERLQHSVSPDCLAYVKTITSVEWAKGYAAGLLDGEGCIRLSSVQRKPHWKPNIAREVIVNNTDPDIIYGFMHALSILGISYRLYGYQPRNQAHAFCWDVRVFGWRSFEKISELGVVSGKKRKTLAEINASYTRRSA